MKNSKKIALGTLMACLITGNMAFAANTVVEGDYFNVNGENVVYGETKDLDLSNIVTDKTYGVVSYANGIVNTANAGDVNISVKRDGYGVGVAACLFGEKQTDGSYKATHGGTVNLGNENTKNIVIDVNVSGDNEADGILVTRSMNDEQFAPSFVNVKAENLVINATSENGYAVGIWAQNNKVGQDNPTTIVLDAQNTIINAVTGDKNPDSAGEYKNIGIVAYSGSKVIAKNNLTINAGTAISTRGGAVTKINEDGTGTVKINGDINFNYDQPTSGTAVDAVVDINLTNKDSYMNGNIFVNGNPFPPDDKKDVSAMTMGLSNEAQWTTTDNSFVNNLKVNGGIVNVDGDNNKLDIGNLNGSNGTFNVSSINNSIDVGKREDDTAVTVSGTSEITDKIAAGEVSLDDIAGTMNIDEGSKVMNVESAEGTILGKLSATTKADGTIDTATINEDVNTSNAGISDMASLALVAWRAENNDMNKRLGELRDSNGEHGVWVRMMRGESEYSSVKNQYNTYQLGYDEKLSTDPSWIVGVAVSYTEGDSSFDKGGGENKHRGISLYGSKLNEDGSFIDLIAKYAQLDHEYTVAGGVGDCDYDANGYSVSAEYGKRFTQDNGFWFEPQVELTYGTVGSANYTAETGALVQQDDMDSLVGRVGFRLGKNIEKGNVYARASYLYDFDGETNVSFTDGVTRSIEQDLGGGWFEVGVGTNINLSKATYLYADVERTFGGEVDTPWQYNVGVRYSF